MRAPPTHVCAIPECGSGQDGDGLPRLRTSYSAQLPAAQSTPNKAAAISAEWRTINVGDGENVSAVEFRHPLAIAAINGVVAVGTQDTSVQGRPFECDTDPNPQMAFA